MTFTYSTTAVPQEGSMLRGNVAFVAGHWTTTTVTASSIVTGGTDVLWGVAQATATANGAIGINLNQNGIGTETRGQLRIHPGTASQNGTWAAIVRVSGTVDPSDS